MSNADIFLTALSFVLAVINIRLVIKANILNKANAKLAASIPQQSPFDPLIASGKGMDVINDFLKTNYLKFINSKLITLNEEKDTPITQFLSIISSVDEMSKLTTGFVGYITTIMSKDMKNFFNRFYNIYDENGEINSIYVQYISDWFVLSIREMQAELTSSNLNEDYSIENNIKINSYIFADIELSLYKRYKIIQEQTEEKKK